MAHLMFVDESGTDRGSAPYEVLAGMVVRDSDVWRLTEAVRDLERQHFDDFDYAYAVQGGELKARKLLNKKTFRLASQMPPLAHSTRAEEARKCLEAPETATRLQLTALAQAKLALVHDLLRLCAQFRCRAIASIMSRTAARPVEGYLRRDFHRLFERFYYLVNDCHAQEVGLVVLDEIERSNSHRLVADVEDYFRRTPDGKRRGTQIIPQPLFVHSDLTIGIQLADIVAYIVSWGFRDITEMTEPDRPELRPFVDRVRELRCSSRRHIEGRGELDIWSFAYVKDLGGVQS